MYLVLIECHFLLPTAFTFYRFDFLRRYKHATPQVRFGLQNKHYNDIYHGGTTICCRYLDFLLRRQRELVHDEDFHGFSVRVAHFDHLFVRPSGALGHDALVGARFQHRLVRNLDGMIGAQRTGEVLLRCHGFDFRLKTYTLSTARGRSIQYTKANG